MELQIGAILVPLSAATLVARPLGVRDLAAATVAFAITAAALAPDGVPPLALLGTTIALVAGMELARPAWRVPGALGAGAVAACWGAILHTLGLGLAPAWLAGAALIAGVLALARWYPNLAATRLREEGLLIVSSCALLGAAGPTVIAGWESAAAFRAQPIGTDAAPGGSWLVMFVLGCVAAGACYTTWRRR